MWSLVSSVFVILTFVSSVCLISSSGFLLCDCHSVGDPPEAFDPAKSLPAPSTIALALAILQFLTAFLLAIQNIRRGWWLTLNFGIFAGLLLVVLIWILEGSKVEVAPKRLIAFWATLALDLLTLTVALLYFALFCPQHQWTSDGPPKTDIEKEPLTLSQDD